MDNGPVSYQRTRRSAESRDSSYQAIMRNAKRRFRHSTHIELETWRDDVEILETQNRFLGERSDNLTEGLQVLAREAAERLATSRAALQANAGDGRAAGQVEIAAVMVAKINEVFATLHITPDPPS